LSDAGIEFHQELCIEPVEGKVGAMKAISHAYSSGVRFDGLFAFSDVLAMAAMRVLNALELRIPEDVAVVGYDDILLSSYFMPPISSIRQDRELGGRLLVEKLLAVMDGEVVDSTVLETSLVVRQSSTLRN
jgi:DNA-binding LacI/PurR family transcriptional regulator